MSLATRDNIAKLYVATFNRAPDAAGLNYWVNTGMSIEDISQSFFDQTETQTLYPTGTTTTAFVTSVYQNLFNRAPDQAGLDYWVHELDTHSVSNQNFILAVMNGAQNSAAGQDSTILENKKSVGLSFADHGLEDVSLAYSVMANVDELPGSIDSAIAIITSTTIPSGGTTNNTFPFTLTDGYVHYTGNDSFTIYDYGVNTDATVTINGMTLHTIQTGTFETGLTIQTDGFPSTTMPSIDFPDIIVTPGYSWALPPMDNSIIPDIPGMHGSVDATYTYITTIGNYSQQVHLVS